MHYLLQFFECSHLEAKAYAAAVPFQRMANELDKNLPDNPEKTTALRKLLESKDCALRAVEMK